MSTPENHLIELLPRDARRRLLGIAERVQLVQSAVLGGAGEPTRHVYFPVNGFISLVTVIDGKPALEVGMVGREGMFGAQVALAWRVPISAFSRELAQCGQLLS